ncbi:serine hydrolase [Aerococcaceae bacterium DSM 109653]|uniref:Serine hydrolase n=1 Tax=Fundicoccus ignavus TaxID=2664442 RepID=A0A844BZY1_9LACT|nr:serine hydrolase [Fundicoccus ignavus]MRI81977.1 serine hydrolase [Fundicoccus ignavus]
MSRKNKLIIGGVAGGIVTACLLLYLFFQPNIHQAYNSWLDNYQTTKLIKETNYYEKTPIYQLHPITFDPTERILIESLRLEGPNLSVGNRDGEPLMETLVKEEVVENLPWFYYSPNVKEVSPTSLVQKNRLLERENLNGFAWYWVDGSERLFQFDEPYTGWHATVFDGWYYYNEGIVQPDLGISSIEAAEILSFRSHISSLIPINEYRPFFIEDPEEFSTMVESRTIQYSILYKAQDQIVLTSPPGTYGSRFLTNTQAFEDMPMEVVEEVSTLEGDWLHVMIGYEDLGWIKKDETFTNYVLNYYSEQELLDTIEAVLYEELGNISANAGASFVNNETMSQVSANNQAFFPASTQKIYVLAELYHQYSTGELDPDQYIEMTWEDQVPGAGIIQAYPSGSMFTLDELVDLVAIYSDNTAANLLIDAVGGGEVITPHMHQLGFYDTYVDGKYYNTRDGYFYTKPADAARIFALLYNNRINGEPWDEMYIEKLYQNSHNFLRQFIPYTTTGWNKSGLGATEQNDVATFVTPYGSYSLAVYTDDPWNYSAVGTQMGNLSLRIHEVFNELRLQLWVTVEDESSYFEPVESLELDEWTEDSEAWEEEWTEEVWSEE